MHFMILRNLSDSGICLDAYPGAVPGSEIEFCFDSDGPRKGIVRWVENGRCGVSAQLSGVTQACDSGYFRPRSVRLPLSLDANLFVHGWCTRVAIKNLSLSGTCIDGVSGLAIGQLVSIQIGDHSFEQATVRWSEGGRCGMRFAKPLSRSEICQIIGSLQVHGPSQAQVKTPEPA